MNEPSATLQARLEELEREGGGLVGTYRAILAITKGASQGKAGALLVDARPSEGVFLAGDPDLVWLMEGVPSHTDDCDVNNLPEQPGVYCVTVEAQMALGYSNGSRAPGEDYTWFRIQEAALAMTLDLQEPADPRRSPNAPGEPIGFTQDDLRTLKKMVYDWMRIHDTMNGADIPGTQQAARFLRTIDRLLPPECHLCGLVIAEGADIKSGVHRACLEEMFGPEPLDDAGEEGSVLQHGEMEKAELVNVFVKFFEEREEVFPLEEYEPAFWFLADGRETVFDSVTTYLDDLGGYITTADCFAAYFSFGGNPTFLYGLQDLGEGLAGKVNAANFEKVLGADNLRVVFDYARKCLVAPVLEGSAFGHAARGAIGFTTVWGHGPTLLGLLEMTTAGGGIVSLPKEGQQVNG